MTATDAMIAKINTATDPKLLKSWRANGLRSGNTAIAESALRQLAGIGAEGEPGSLLHDVWQTIHAFEQVLSEANGRTTRLTRTRQKLAKSGVIAAATDFLATGPGAESGSKLHAMGLGDLSMEAAVVRHAGDFPESQVEAARTAIAAAG